MKSSINSTIMPDTTKNRFIRCSIKNLFHIKIIKILEYRCNNKCDYIIY